MTDLKWIKQHRDIYRYFYIRLPGICVCNQQKINRHREKLEITSNLQ